MRITRRTAHILDAPEHYPCRVPVRTDASLRGIIGEARALGHADAPPGRLKETGRSRVLSSAPPAIEDPTDHMMRRGAREAMAEGIT